jgi:hypothetical protein
MEYHPIASIFPLLPDQEIGAMSEDIQKNGLLNPILTYEGKILDGRNRFRACNLVGVAPTFSAYDGEDPVGHVLSLNLHRRQLTASQRAAVATESLPHFEAEAEKRRREKISDSRTSETVELVPPSQEVKSRDQAGALVGVNGRYVSEAKRIKEESPETFEKVKAGEISIKGAIKELFVPKVDQEEAPQIPDRIAPSESMSIAKRIGILLNTISPSDRMAMEAVKFVQGRLDAKTKDIKNAQ